MPRMRNRLIAAARRSMLQRGELHRRLDVARRGEGGVARDGLGLERRGREGGHHDRNQIPHDWQGGG